MSEAGKKAEEALAQYLRFRITMVGNRKLEHLAYFGEGTNAMLRVKSTRPATQQECKMWDHILGLLEQMVEMGWNPSAGMAAGKEHLPGGGGVDATTVRDPLGNPRE